MTGLANVATKLRDAVSQFAGAMTEWRGDLAHVPLPEDLAGPLRAMSMEVPEAD